MTGEGRIYTTVDGQPAPIEESDDSRVFSGKSRG